MTAEETKSKVYSTECPVGNHSYHQECFQAWIDSTSTQKNECLMCHKEI